MRRVNSVARKKIVFVIVEGPSDDTALGVMLTRFFDKNLVRVEITHGDITTRDWASTQNIAARIGDLVRHYAAANHFKDTDFQEVIHIVDTDGAFIPDDAIMEDPNCLEPYYLPTEIRTDKPTSIRKRNEGKSAILTRLASLKYVWKTIPYRIYYMSCNLDHVLHNKQNSSDTEKENDAYSFARRYRDRLPEFLTFICDSDFSVRLDYKDSWDFIRQGLRSLERHSNLGLCFEPDSRMEYKGYEGSIEFSEEDGVYFGKVQNVDSLISYEGATPVELLVDFHKAVDDYLTQCEADHR